MRPARSAPAGDIPAGAGTARQQRQCKAPPLQCMEAARAGMEWGSGHDAQTLRVALHTEGAPHGGCNRQHGWGHDAQTLRVALHTEGAGTAQQRSMTPARSVPAGDIPAGTGTARRQRRGSAVPPLQCMKAAGAGMKWGRILGRPRSKGRPREPAECRAEKAQHSGHAQPRARRRLPRRRRECWRDPPAATLDRGMAKGIRGPCIL